MMHRALALLIVLVAPFAATAQTAITVDATLPASTIGAIAAEPDGTTFVIGEDHGVRSGANLFHSFDLFDLGTGDTASFQPDFATDNLISRITGGASMIDGTLRTQVPSGAGNLFLLNPAGIVFGAGAQLDVQGSFYTSTADAVRFGDSNDFATSATAVPILSPLSPVAFGFLGTPIGSGIEVMASNLEVPDDHEIAVVSHDIRIDGGKLDGDPTEVNPTPQLRAGGDLGRVRLASVASAEDVSLLTEFDPFTKVGTDFALPEGAAGTVLVSGGGVVESGAELFVGAARSVSARGVGLFAQVVPERNDSVLEGVRLVRIETPTLSLESGGRIVSDLEIGIDAGTLSLVEPPLSGSPTFSESPRGSGAGIVILNRFGGPPGPGVIEIVASESVSISGIGAGIAAEAKEGAGPGRLFIETPALQLERGSTITTRTLGTTDAGLVRLDVETLRLSDNALIESAFFDFGFPVSPPGAAGSILIGDFDGARYETRTVELDGSTLSTSGAEGSIRIVASEQVTLGGRSDLGFSFLGVGLALITADNDGNPGAAGSIRIETPVLVMNDEASISSETSSAFSAGDLDLDVGTLSMSTDTRISSSSTPNVFRIGVFPGNFPCTVCEDAVAAGPVPVEAAPHGDAGAIRIEATSATLGDGAAITTETNGSGAAGSITMDVGALFLSSDARITSSSDTTGGPSVPPESRVAYWLDSSSGSLVVKEVLPGAAGSITIGVPGGQHATSRVVLAASTVTTRADQGPAAIVGEDPAVTETRREGNITLNATDLVLLVDQSAITASVGTGLGGSVRIGPTQPPGATVLRGASAITAQATGADGMGGVAGQDQGGRIEITSDVIFRAPDTVISADAGAGTAGIVEINSPEVNVESGLAQLPTDFLNASALIRPSCAARSGGEQSSFSIASRRGVASSPEEMLVAYAVSGDSTPAALVVDAPQQLAAADTASADTAFRGGRFQAASEGYAELAEQLAGEGDPVSRGSALRNLAQSQQAMGRYASSADTLRGALALAEANDDQKGAAEALGSLGNASIALGRADEAEKLLTRGVVLAESIGEEELAAGILNNLGNHYVTQQAYGDALASYEQAAALAAKSHQPAAEAKALANAARASLDAGELERSTALLERAAARSATLDASHEQIELWIHQARTWEQLAEVDATQRAAGLLGAYTALQRAEALARRTRNERALSYANGNLGALYQAEHRSNEALYLTRKALRAAKRADAPESEYRWHWQEGRILWSQGRAEEAIASYRRAVEILEETRQEAQGQYGSAAAYFRRAVAPVYLDLVAALLEGSERLRDGARVEPLLLEARSTVERLKAAELRDYFRDECVAELQAKTTTLESASATASIVYPIVLPERLELLVSTKAGVSRYTVAVDAETLSKAVGEFRSQLSNRTSNRWLETSAQLYDWLVRPFADVIAAQGIDTLVFVPDGALRRIPMAALFDGEQVLGERYAIAVTPSLSLVDPKPLAREDVRMLSGGVSESVGGFPALAMVPRELEAVHARYGGDVLLDGDFRLAQVEAKIAQSQPTIVHIASHAVFSGEPETSFLLTHDDRLTMDRLSTAIGVTKFRDDPLELLVLSACETAAGDDRAGLGLAGVAIRAGARSAVGSLWSIADEAAFQLVDEFYRQLEDPAVSKAVALQRAQAHLRADARFAHPYFWSPFLMINNWL